MSRLRVERLPRRVFRGGVASVRTCATVRIGFAGSAVIYPLWRCGLERMKLSGAGYRRLPGPDRRFPKWSEKPASQSVTQVRASCIAVGRGSFTRRRCPRGKPRRDRRSRVASSWNVAGLSQARQRCRDDDGVASHSCATARPAPTPSGVIRPHPVSRR